MHKLMSITVLLLFLGGCAGGLQQAVEGVKKVKDAEALLLKQGLCAMSIGAKNRVLTPSERVHAEALCGGGEQEQTVTVETLRMLGLIK